MSDSEREFFGTETLRPFNRGNKLKRPSEQNLNRSKPPLWRPESPQDVSEVKHLF